MKIPKLTLSILPEKLGICQLGKRAPIPSWSTEGSNFSSITKTSKELSIVCPQEKIPVEVRAEKNWRAFKLEGPLELDMYSVGIIASLSKPLADAGISIFNISTYETDYLLVEERNLAKATKILGKFCEIKK